MATITRPRIVIEVEVEDLDLLEGVSIALSDLAVAARQGLVALAIGVGLAVVDKIFEEEVSWLVGVRGQQVAGRVGLSPRP